MAPATMTVAVSGSHGLVGSACSTRLSADGHRVLRLVRGQPQNENEIEWDPRRGVTRPQAVEGIDAFIHLAGANIADGRWTRRRRELLWTSRVNATRALADSLTRLARPPRVLLCASAVGIYGDRGDEILTETSTPGSGFLADLCVAWEAAAASAARAQIRVVHLRFGAVLAATGGLLARLLGIFRAGFGGPLGRGAQYMSWIAIEDAVAVIRRALHDEHLAGPVNVVAPQPVRNREFAHTLGRVLHRPAVCRVPAFVLRLAFGQLADEVMLASTRVRPAILESCGFSFRHPTLEQALRAVLSRPATPA